MESQDSPAVNDRQLEKQALAADWKRLRRAATIVGLITAPSFFLLLWRVNHQTLLWSIILTVLGVAAFRGLIDVISHWLLPKQSLYGADSAALAQHRVDRRRTWFWRFWFRLAFWIGAIFLIGSLFLDGSDVDAFLKAAAPIAAILAFQMPLLFLTNILILFGPLLVMNLRQMKGYEPGDADWGVKLEDVRGQAEPKEEIARVVELWQSGDEFEKAGGKRERGLLFLGQPGTGKTMLSKAIATSFNSPFLTMPGSGFAATFIGIDVIIVMMLIRKARKLARKWGGQCIVFIDEIDAVGTRRRGLDTGGMGMSANTPVGTGTIHDELFFGPNGALNPSGDLLLETRAWRELIFESRAQSPVDPYPPFIRRLRDNTSQFIGGIGMGGGSLALNQLLVQMDGVDEPPMMRKFFTNRINTLRCPVSDPPVHRRQITAPQGTEAAG